MATSGSTKRPAAARRLEILDQKIKSHEEWLRDVSGASPERVDAVLAELAALWRERRENLDTWGPNRVAYKVRSAKVTRGV